MPVQSGSDVRRRSDESRAISTHFDEKDANGNTFLVQYFERAVLEFHPSNPVGQKVQMKRLGDNYGATDSPWPLTVMQVYRMQ